MKVWKIFIKSLKEQVRDWRTLGSSFLLPPLFMVIFSMAFGAGYYTYKVFILNQDKGISQEEHYSEMLMQRMAQAKYEDGTQIFNICPVHSEVEVLTKLQKHEGAALITIPEDFSICLHAGTAGEEGISPAKVMIKGDPGFPAFSLVKLIFDTMLTEFLSEQTGYRPPLESEAIYMGVQRKGSEFDYIAPGMMLFAIFMLIFQVSIVLVKETEQKTLQRLLLAPVHPWQILTGVGITQLLFAAIMVPMMFFTAVWVGFNTQGALIDGIIVGVLTSISAIALGLWVAAFSRNATQAFIISNALIVPVVFLSGVFFPLPQVELFSLGTRVFTLFDLQPATHAVNAFKRIFLHGASLGDVGYELAWLLILSSLYFWGGLIFWRRAHTRVP